MASILAVDDSASMRQMVTLTLQSAGYEVVEAQDGAQALGIAQTTKVSLVLADVNMPNMDGSALIRALRALPHYKFTPILILTIEGWPITFHPCFTVLQTGNAPVRLFRALETLGSLTVQVDMPPLPVYMVGGGRALFYCHGVQGSPPRRKGVGRADASYRYRLACPGHSPAGCV